MNRIFIRGDTHGNYNFLSDFCAKFNTTTEDILIVLGDNGICFEGENSNREKYRKEKISKYPITIFAIRGNHDRPYSIGNDREAFISPYDNQLMYHDPKYENIWYLIDGFEYNFNGFSFLILGGAFSVDWEYRLMMHWTWYNGTEMITPEFRDIIYDRASKLNPHYNFVLSHTCPYSWRPVDSFKLNVPNVDTSMEQWMEDLCNVISFDHWMFGHYHEDRPDIMNGTLITCGGNEILGDTKVSLLYNYIMEVQENGNIITVYHAPDPYK